MIVNEASVDKIDIGGVNLSMYETTYPRNKIANKNNEVTLLFSKSGNKDEDTYHNAEDGININANNSGVKPSFNINANMTLADKVMIDWLIHWYIQQPI